MSTRYENKKQHQSSSENSSMRLSFKQKYWAIHEAAWELTGWPDQGIFEFSGIKIDVDVRQDRQFFYMPISGSIEFKHFGEPFERMSLAIKNAIENYDLKGRFQHLCCGSSYLVCPWDIVVWALRNGLRIREGVQRVLNIHQDLTKPKDSFRENISDAIKAQNLISQDKLHRVGPACEQIKGGKDTSTLRKYLSAELFDGPGKPGRVPNSSDAKNNTRHYLHKVLKDVCEVQADGVMKYQFILLEEVITTIIREILTTINCETMQKIDVDAVFEKFGFDPIAKLYLKEAPEIVFHFACQVIEELFFSFQDECTPKLSEQFKESPLFKER